MKDHTTNPVLRKTLRDLLIHGLSLIGSKIFRTDDRRACERGWQVLSRHGGLSRTYRDPRFDDLIRCAACSDRGRDLVGVTCATCDGAGRIILNPAEASEPGRGQP
jgi:hypothetical protein